MLGTLNVKILKFNKNLLVLCHILKYVFIYIKFNIIFKYNNLDSILFVYKLKQILLVDVYPRRVGQLQTPYLIAL